MKTDENTAKHGRINLSGFLKLQMALKMRTVSCAILQLSLKSGT